MKLRFVWFLSAFIAIVGFVLFANIANNQKKIADINIDIKKSKDKFISDKRVQKIIKANRLHLQKSNQLDVFELENSLDRNPFVKKSQVYKTLKGNLNIEITQKEAIARIKTPKSEYYIDNYGEKMQLSKRYSSNIIFIKSDINALNIKMIYKFVRFIQNNEKLKKIIIGIEYKKNEFFLKTRIAKHIVELGKLDDFEQKINNLMVFYDSFLGGKGWGYYSHVNLKYKNQIVCTKKDAIIKK